MARALHCTTLHASNAHKDVKTYTCYSGVMHMYM